MKISKIYSNKPGVFKPIRFNDGFNVIIGEIRLPHNKDKDSHNLGKSKLADLIDFGFLKKRGRDMFLFKHFELFEKFVFYFEIKLNDYTYITIRRSVASNSKINIKRHYERYQDFVSLNDSNWDYDKLPIGKAKLILDGLLDLSVISPWDYRMAVSYALRSQNDFDDIFQLKKFSRGKDISWKPYIGHILGFEAENLKKNYELRARLDKISDTLEDLQKEVGFHQGDEEEMLHDFLGIKLRDATILQTQLDTFNFDEVDVRTVEELSENIDGEIEELNRVRYYIKSNLNKLKKAQSKQPVSFNVSQTERLFEEAGVMFGDQIKRSYQDLLEFNQKITVERVKFVTQQINELEDDLITIGGRLTELNTIKSQRISFLTSTNAFDKYKETSTRLLAVNTEINSIKRKLEISEEIKEEQGVERGVIKQKNKIIDDIRLNKEAVVKSENSVYKKVKDNFVGFVKTVLDKDGTLSTEQNKEGNLVFHAGFVDNNLNFTSEADGHTYKKILCIAYDLATSLAYSNQNFVQFIYHDGGLETLDERKKIEFLKYVRTIPESFGTQYILTLIDSDLPKDVDFTDEEVVLTLHDDGPSGLLFNMRPW